MATQKELVDAVREAAEDELGDKAPSVADIRQMMADSAVAEFIVDSVVGRFQDKERIFQFFTAMIYELSRYETMDLPTIRKKLSENLDTLEKALAQAEAHKATKQ